MILLTGWTPIDPLLSIVVAAIIVRSGWQVVADAGHILLEGAPEELDTRAIGPDLIANVKGVEERAPRACLVDHAEPAHGDAACLHRRDRQIRTRCVKSIKARLKERFGLDHATVEIERGVCADAAPAKRQGVMMNGQRPTHLGRGSVGRFPLGRAGHPCRQERVVRHRPGRDRGAGRRVGLGQDGDGAVDPQAPPLPLRVASFGEDPVQRRESAGAAAGGARARSGATRSR